MRTLHVVGPANFQEHEVRGDRRLRYANEQAKEMRKQAIQIDPEKTVMSWDQFDWLVIQAFYAGMNYRDHEIMRDKL